jgi:parvulin-like peptidyl-prolyl isomerase
MKSFQSLFLQLFTVILALIVASSLQAEPPDAPFTLNGRPVPKVVAQVNETQLSSDFLEREMTAFKLMSRQQGREIKSESEDKIARKILQGKIEEELIYQKARLASVQVPDEIILKEIEKIEQQFPDPKLFERALAMQHLTRGSLREKIERQLVAEKYLRQVIVPKIKRDQLDPKGHYENNKTGFMKPKMYDVSHIFVGTMDVSSQKNVADQASKKKAQRILDGINKEAHDKISTVVDKLKNGEGFKKLANDFSEDESSKEKGGSLGVLLPETTIPEIAAEMTKLALGESSGIIQSSYGYHIIRLNNIIASHLATFEEVKSDILNLLMVRETQKLKEELLTRLKKAADIKIFI